MDGTRAHAKPPRKPTLWREGGSARVAAGAAVGAAGGMLYATARAVPAPGVVRAGLACGVLAAPFFALREVVAAGVGVDGPVASAIAGGFAGYFGALVVSGPQWQAVSHGAMVVGIGCGVVDIVVSGLDWRRKVYLVDRHDAAVTAAAAALRNKSAAEADGTGAGGEGSLSVRSSQRDALSPWLKWPVWFPVLKEIDEEYHELIRRQEATVLALEEEQARIALLLEALESVKAGNRTDAELAEAGRAPSSESPSVVPEIQTGQP